MMISTRGRYALRVLVYLAENSDAGYIPMKNVAKAQGISLKYLEQILPVLAKNGIIEGLQGKGGGYRLAVSPEECKIGTVLRLTEGGLAPVACLGEGAASCARMPECRTYPLWSEFYGIINDFFDGKTLADIIGTEQL